MSAPIRCRPAPAFGSFDIPPDSETVRSEQFIQFELYARSFGIQVPPLKFVVPGDNRIYFIPSEYLKTYGDMKMAVADKLQIDVDGVLDMSLEPIQPSDWNIPMFSDPVLTVVWKSKSLAIKIWLPCPRRITVGELLGIVQGYLGQLMDSPLDLPLVPRLTSSELCKLRIEDGSPSDLVDFVRKKGCAECVQQPTVFVGIVGIDEAVTHSHSTEGMEPQMVYVVVQNLWMMVPSRVQPRPDLVVPASLSVSQVKAMIEQEFWETLGLGEEEDRAGVLLRHNMVSAAPEGRWDEIADQDLTAVGTMRMAVRSVLTYYRRRPVTVLCDA
ncbi:hypothetical protein FN846DRAFT_911150 [Sphaerosporella brunnea]|uniref:Uncharacterized protein n=1 Tax=Sphaerosporella brunnea TaxID=1250544 RepID=A0A5J5EML4_9PEZI|nr:hypothetical protein FN846DRAFT_911150 [Sphaerosporella brunnea]